MLPCLGMIVSSDDIERFVGDDGGIDSSRSATDSSAFHTRHSSHDSESGNSIAFPIFDGGIIMDLVHERESLLGIQDSDISDIPIGNKNIIFSPIGVIIYSCPIRTDDIS